MSYMNQGYVREFIEAVMIGDMHPFTIITWEGKQRGKNLRVVCSQNSLSVIKDVLDINWDSLAVNRALINKKSALLPICN